MGFLSWLFGHGPQQRNTEVEPTTSQAHDKSERRGTSEAEFRERCKEMSNVELERLFADTRSDRARRVIGEVLAERAAPTGSPHASTLTLPQVVAAMPPSDDCVTVVPRMFWQCPECGGILQKEQGTLQVAPKLGGLVGSATCSFCQVSQDANAVYSGHFDFVWSDDDIQHMKQDPDNIVFDPVKKRWIYKGKVLLLVSDARAIGERLREALRAPTASTIPQELLRPRRHDSLADAQKIMEDIARRARRLE